MILRIELWDWESHEHTVIDDISAGLNLFCGDSNSGKTSVVRSLALVAYNQFDPKSIRIGATKCVVQVDTERGRVKVTRGPKHNIWETTRPGQATQYFDKVGVNIVPEAADILGLKIVTLGDVQIPVNIMDQLESHFMLAGIGDKNASGSMRAQIVDEISGLSGIEALIKEVSLDHHRFGREITETEKKMEDTRKQLHPENELKAEEDILVRAEKELSDHTQMIALAFDGDALIAGSVSLQSDLGEINRALQAIPDTDLAMGEITRAEAKTRQAVPAEAVLGDFVIASGKLSIIQSHLTGMPDERLAFSHLDLANRDVEVIAKSESLLSTSLSVRKSLKSKQDRLVGMPNEQEALDHIERADEDVAIVETAESFLKTCDTTRKNLQVKQDRLNKLGTVSSDQHITDAATLMDHKSKAEELLVSAQRIRGLLDKMNRMIAFNSSELQMAEKDRDELLSSIKTCPLTLRPVSKECVA